MPGEDHEECQAMARRINQLRPQWLVVWGVCSLRFWAFPLFEMRPRGAVYDMCPDALLARLDEVESRCRVWPDREG